MSNTLISEVFDPKLEDLKFDPWEHHTHDPHWKSKVWSSSHGSIGKIAVVMESEILESAIRDLERSHEDRMARKLLIKDVDRKVLERVSSYAWEQLHLGT